LTVSAGFNARFNTLKMLAIFHLYNNENKLSELPTEFVTNMRTAEGSS